MCVCNSQLTFFVLGVNCSEVVGKENCESICENGKCVHVSPTSFRCICDKGASGKPLPFSWLLVKYKWIVCHYDDECYHTGLILDRRITHRRSVFPNAVHQRQRDTFCSIPVPNRNHVICLEGATIFGKVKAENYKSHISSKDQHFLMGLKPDAT